jgi:hypothetical protein
MLFVFSRLLKKKGMVSINTLIGKNSTITERVIICASRDFPRIKSILWLLFKIGIKMLFVFSRLGQNF